MSRSRVEVSIDAPPDRIWWACSTIDGLSAWQADEVSGSVVRGGMLEFRWPGLGLSADVEVTTLQPMRSIALSTPSWRLNLELHGSVLALTLEGPRSTEELAGAMSGWKLSLAMLRHQLIHHWGGSRVSDWIVRPVQASAAQLHVFFSDPVGLHTWLGDTKTSLGEEGTPVQLALRWGEALAGEMLAHTPERDLALSWQQHGNSLLSMRSLPSPRSEHERLVLLQWSRWHAASAETNATLEHLDASLSRLAQLFVVSGSA